MRRLEIPALPWKLGIAALGAWVGLGFTEAQAQGQSPLCGDLFDECAIAEAVLAWNLDQFQVSFPFDGTTCEKMTKNVSKQCEAAVKASVACWKGQVGFIPKAAKPACKTAGDFAGECEDGFDSIATRDKDLIQTDGEEELVCCEEIAVEFFSACRFGRP